MFYDDDFRYWRSYQQYVNILLFNGPHQHFVKNPPSTIEISWEKYIEFFGVCVKISDFSCTIFFKSAQILLDAPPVRPFLMRFQSAILQNYSNMLKAGSSSRRSLENYLQKEFLARER